MKNKFWPVLLLAATIGLGGGCAFYEGGPAAAAPATPETYEATTLKCTVDASFDTTFNAVLAGLKDLNDAVVDKTGDVLAFKIIARAPGDDKITVTLSKVSGAVTDISIRVNTFGDEDASNTVMAAIKKYL